MKTVPSRLTTSHSLTADKIQKFQNEFENLSATEKELLRELQDTVYMTIMFPVSFRIGQFTSHLAKGLPSRDMTYGKHYQDASVAIVHFEPMNKIDNFNPFHLLQVDAFRDISLQTDFHRAVSVALMQVEEEDFLKKTKSVVLKRLMKGLFKTEQSKKELLLIIKGRLYAIASASISVVTLAPSNSYVKDVKDIYKEKGHFHKLENGISDSGKFYKILNKDVNESLVSISDDYKIEWLETKDDDVLSY